MQKWHKEEFPSLMSSKLDSEDFSPSINELFVVYLLSWG